MTHVPGCFFITAAAAAPCPGNPEAIGVSRVLTVNARDYSRLGRMQYHQSLPLDDREVVLTFDDGPLPPYTDRVLETLARHCVKAGITGWAQVNGWRGNTSIEKRIEYDLYYIENWSVRLDLKIMWLTLLRGFFHKHAY